jgi:hypothetical protein
MNASRASAGAERRSGALGFFADLARGRATAAVARDLGVPDHYLRLAVGKARARATAPRRRRQGRRLAIDECALRKPFVFATIFSDPERGVVVDVAPGRDGAAIWAFAGLYSRDERAQVQVVSSGWRFTAGSVEADMTTASWPPLASIGDRFLARLIDGIIFTIPLFVVQVAFMSGAGRLGRLALGLLLGALYFVVPVALYGQTPEKAIRRIRVIASDGGRPGWGRAARRYLVEIVGPLMPVFGLLPADALI